MTEPTHTEWWKSAVIYQIYPRSFQDSTGNGTGDLNGIYQRLDYVASLNVDAVWISPFYTSPMKDYGYDVSDYRNVDPLFGTLDDFKKLLEKAHSLGLKILMDQVWCHTSDEHPWFLDSVARGDKADWYVWADTNDNGQPPNNWLAIFGGVAWTWHPQRQQYYLHHFLKEQPALNWYNPDVQEAMLDVGRFWLDLGVNGYRFDVVNFLMHDPQLRDNPKRQTTDAMPAGGSDALPFFSFINQHNIGQTQTHEMVKHIRAMLDEYPATTSLAEISSAEDALYEAQQCVGEDKLHMAYNSSLMTDEPLSAEYLRHILNDAKALITNGGLCWTAGTHDFPRLASRWKKHLEHDHFNQEAFNYMLLMLLIALPGSCCLYQGDELGLPEAELTYEQLRDPFGIANYPRIMGRDGCRTPMPWNNTEKNYGFSSADETWLPVSTTHHDLSVTTQEDHPYSLLNHYRAVIAWRKNQPALKRSLSLDLLETEKDILGFIRGKETEQPLLFLFNPTTKTQNQSLETLPAFTRICDTAKGTRIFANETELAPFSVCVCEI